MAKTYTVYLIDSINEKHIIQNVLTQPEADLSACSASLALHHLGYKKYFSVDKSEVYGAYRKGNESILILIVKE